MVKISNLQKSEPRLYRVNARITESQHNFIIKNNLSVTKILNESLKNKMVYKK
jgi:hypothetical protein